MKIVFKKTVEQKVEQEFEAPVYVDHGLGIHMVQNETDYIEVGIYKSQDGELLHHMIDIRKGYPESVAIVLGGGKQVDKACFDNAWQRAVSAINQMDRELKANDPEFLEDMNAKFHETNNRMIEQYGHEAEQFNL